MSSKELKRVEVLGRVKSGDLTLVEAAELLEVSYRQCKRLWKCYREEGRSGLQHGNCKRKSNRAKPEKFRQQVLKRVQQQYPDFGATLASEHLEKEDGLRVHAETLRRWLLAAGLRERQRKRKPYRQRRERKQHFGNWCRWMAASTTGWKIGGSGAV